MNIAVIGLGLIGGSFARAIKEFTGHKVFGCDTDISSVYAAKLCRSIDGEADDNILAEADMVLIALYPEATIEFLEEKKEIIKKGAVVVDSAGVKRRICAEGYEIAGESGFYFIGGHPMAGIQFSGFANSRADMFSDATMLLCAKKNEDLSVMEKTKNFFYTLGFSSVRFVAADDHDRMIAFTSQLAHVVSNAYIKSPNALMHRGFSAGSYKDLTRVARLNPQMWAKLFLENRDNLIFELDTIIKNLSEYKKALEAGDEERLTDILKEGSDRKIMAEKSGESEICSR